MKIASMILLGLGALFCGLIGIKWLGDISDLASIMGGSSAPASLVSEISNLKYAAILLVVSLFTGIIGIVLTAKGKSKLASYIVLPVIMIAVFFHVKSLAPGFLLILGGVLAYFVKDNSVAKA